MSSPPTSLPHDVQKCILDHLPLVKTIAERLRRRLPASIEKDDLLQVGMLGLCEALLRFDARRGVSFDSYASRRIEGAMLDELRALDALPRRRRAAYRRIRDAVRDLGHALGRAPRAGEVARSLGMSLSEVHGVLAEAGAGGVRAEDVPLERLDEADLGREEVSRVARLARVDTDPMLNAEAGQQLATLCLALGELTEMEIRVMDMLYMQDMRLKDVASAIGLSASRVFQMQQAVIEKLGARVRPD